MRNLMTLTSWSQVDLHSQLVNFSYVTMWNYLETRSIFWVFIELDMMRERFSKLLLGEDMSGGGKGVCTAVTISNSITNLYGNIFFNSIWLKDVAVV